MVQIERVVYCGVSRLQGSALGIWRTIKLKMNFFQTVKWNVTICRPRRYELAELVDWFHRVMRKDSDYGYLRYDMKWDPFFKLKAQITPS